MLPELKAHAPKFKEILYNCLERIQATKAALYLLAGEDAYQLISEYGFRDQVRDSISLSDELVDMLRTKRAPFFLNGLGEDPRFAELLDRSDTTRMLVAPIYSQGRLYGLIDMRDKAAQKPFSFEDVDEAQKIGRQFLELFAEKNLLGLTQRSAAEPPPVESKPLPSQEVPLFRGANRHVDEAQKMIARGVLRTKTSVRTLSQEDVTNCSALLPAALSLQGALIAAFSAGSELGGHQVIMARNLISDAASQQFQAKLRGWLQKRGEPDKITTSTVEYPFGTTGPPIEPNLIVSTLSAPVRLSGFSAPVLTVAFGAPPTPDVRSRLEKLLSHLEQIVRQAVAAADLRTLRHEVARRLLEPDFQQYQLLKNHSERVADLAEGLAQFIGLSPEEVENVKLAAYLHDVGMRLLDYSSLYRKPTLTTEDMALLKQHPVVGAAVIADSPLGSEIARIVYHHHERFDGTGYPDGIGAEQIPIGAQIIGLCEAFDAMTASDSYQSPVPPEMALSKIRRSTQSQFDGPLAEKFIEMMTARG